MKEAISRISLQIKLVSVWAYPPSFSARGQLPCLIFFPAAFNLVYSLGFCKLGIWIFFSFQHQSFVILWWLVTANNLNKVSMSNLILYLDPPLLHNTFWHWIILLFHPVIFRLPCGLVYLGHLKLSVSPHNYNLTAPCLTWNFSYCVSIYLHIY